MSVEAVLNRITEIQRALDPRPAQVQGNQFATMLASSSSNAPAAAYGAGAAPAFGAVPVGPTGALPGGGPGAQMVALAAAEVGVAEQPPGSNNSPRIAEYRTATAGSGVGPWCAYFTSWAAKNAGVPMGESGQGFGSVDAAYAWAQRTGRAIPAAGGARPNPGDLIVWDEHIGLVESVNPDGTINTIEGNSSDAVTRRKHDAGGDGALGYIRLG